jgi:hypothetical protein
MFGPGPLSVLEYVPYTAPADVREGVLTGGVPGLLDLPSVNHVLLNVKFDNETKTGALVLERIPSDVELFLQTPFIFEVDP